MAQINFPVATAAGQTFEADTGVIYTYVGTPPNGYWSGTFGSDGTDTLDARYIKKEDGGVSQTIKSSGLKINNNNSDTIVLNGDGSAEFAGDVQSGGSPYGSGSVAGARLDAGGAFVARRSSGDVFTGKSTANNGATTSSIAADGSASFAGDVTAQGVITDNGLVKVFLSSGNGGMYVYDSADTTSPNVVINKDGSITANGVITSNRYSNNISMLSVNVSGTTYGYALTDASSNVIAGITTQGDAEFVGTVSTEDYFTADRDTTSASAALYLGFAKGVQKFKVGVDGSGTFAGAVTTEKFINVRNTDSSLGAIYIGNADGNAGRSNIAFEISPSLSSNDATVRVNYDGSATFAGNVTANSFIGDGSGLTNLPSSGAGDLQAVTDAGNTTTNGATFGDRITATTSGRQPDESTLVLNNTNVDGYSIYSQSNGTGTFAVTAAGSVFVGDSNAASQNIVLRASDGSASFAGNVTVGDYQSGTAGKNGFEFRSSGELVQNRNGGDAYTLYNNSATKTVTITAAGAATFAGDVTVKSNVLVKGGNGSGVFIRNKEDTAYTIDLNEDGSASFAGDITVGGDPDQGVNAGVKLLSGGLIQVSRGNNTANVFEGYAQSLSTSPTSSIGTNGSASFAKQVSVPDCAVEDFALQVSYNTAGAYKFGVLGGGTLKIGGNIANASETNITLDVDGSAIFGDNPDISLTSVGAKIFPSGTIRTRSSLNTSAGILFEGFGHNESTPAFKVVADGSATFNGTVTAGTFNIDALPVLV
jgi:hypothetical protein